MPTAYTQTNIENQMHIIDSRRKQQLKAAFLRNQFLAPKVRTATE